MSNTTSGGKWLTKAVHISSRAVCWSVPFRAAAGKEVKVKLTERNALDLAALGDARQS